MKLGIISDTHGLLRPQVLDNLRCCDYILHAGDFDREDVLDELLEIAPVLGVQGNNDWGRWALRLPQTRVCELGGVKFFIVHNRLDVPRNPGDVQVVVFGHSHRFYMDRIDGRLWINPGSCGYPRFKPELTMALMTLDETGIQVERIDIDR